MELAFTGADPGSVAVPLAVDLPGREVPPARSGARRRPRPGRAQLSHRPGDGALAHPPAASPRSAAIVLALIEAEQQRHLGFQLPAADRPWQWPPTAVLRRTLRTAVDRRESQTPV